MYDAWAAYDPVAVGYLYHQKVTDADPSAARRAAISYAAYRLLIERYALSRNAQTSLAAFKTRLIALGYDPDFTSTNPATPAGMGNLVAATVSAYFYNDGALQTRAYVDLPVAQGGYAPSNPPMIPAQVGTRLLNLNRWQPLMITNALTQNQLQAQAVQIFLGAQWLGVRPFALSRENVTKPWIDPGPPPQFGTVNDSEFRQQVVQVIQRSSELDPADGILLDISPGHLGNNSLGTNDGAGHPFNPATGQPYPSNRVPRADFTRVLAEYWADGPHSETPPGHWNLLANLVSDQPGFEKRLAGTGPVLDPLEWDVKLYFALNAALHDAACAAWSVKRVYDGIRPISAIRYMGQLGQASAPDQPWYDPSGLPLIPGLIEVVTEQTALPGARHAGLPPGEVVLHTWTGQPLHPLSETGGVDWILASTWMPYQPSTFVTPSFPGYTSGHSTFSRAAAEVLTALTGSPFFPGGLATTTIPADTGLKFERGPSQTVQLQWATYYDAADQAGQSRIWGGIHFPIDDFAGRLAGAQCGRQAVTLARQYFDGSILNISPRITILPSTTGPAQLRFETLRGFTYALQSTPSLTLPFMTDPQSHSFQATDSITLLPFSPSGPQEFMRILRLSP